MPNENADASGELRLECLRLAVSFVQVHVVTLGLNDKSVLPLAQEFYKFLNQPISGSANFLGEPAPTGASVKRGL